MRNRLAANHQPDILEAVLAEGAIEMRFGEGVPTEMEFEPNPVFSGRVRQDRVTRSWFPEPWARGTTIDQVGREPRVTGTSCVEPSRWTVTVTVSPG